VNTRRVTVSWELNSVSYWIVDANSFELARLSRPPSGRFGQVIKFFFGEFDPGSGRTLAACLTHASRTMKPFGVD
jgi:hypothetical protein